ncbi:MAG: sodium-dependent transporter [Arcanobacterium sp.]|nr:sodium-dependent transporter [Arcanobacterium sp.]
MATTAQLTGTEPRERWSGQFGFIISAIGSAIGLGNIWRFPGVAYTNGGGAFLIPYLVALLTAGIPILLLDYSLGHRYQGSAPTVFRRLKKRLEFAGWIQVLVCFVIVTYYAVILAWAIRYIIFSLNLAWKEDAGTFFLKDFLQISETPGFNLHVILGIFLPLLALWVAAAFVMSKGIAQGVEKLNRIFIPLLVVIFLALVIRALFLDGAMDGLNAFFTPNWQALTDPQVWIAAYAQIFYSLSVGFGIMLTYSSYLKRRSNITPTGLVAGFANSSFEILAGIGVFATLGFMAASQNVGINELENITGPTLSFITFPTVIAMMPGGPIFGVIFFSSLVIAGFTSLVSLLQVITSALKEKFGLSHKAASITICASAGTISILLFSTSNGLYALDVVDKYINEIGIISCAIFTCIICAFYLKRLPILRAHLNYNSALQIGKWWEYVVAFLVPIVLGYMLIATIIDLVKTPYGGYSGSFNLLFGWLVILLVLIVALALQFAKWYRLVDIYDPMKYHGIESAGGYNDSPQNKQPASGVSLIDAAKE